jgi:hypothetical protein
MLVRLSLYDNDATLKNEIIADCVRHQPFLSFSMPRTRKLSDLTPNGKVDTQS